MFTPIAPALAPAPSPSDGEQRPRPAPQVLRRRDPMDLPVVRPERDRVLPPRQLDRDEQLRRDQQRLAREAAEQARQRAERLRAPREGP